MLHHFNVHYCVYKKKVQLSSYYCTNCHGSVSSIGHCRPEPLQNNLSHETIKLHSQFASFNAQFSCKNLPN